MFTAAASTGGAVRWLNQTGVFGGPCHALCHALCVLSTLGQCDVSCLSVEFCALCCISISVRCVCVWHSRRFCEYFASDTYFCRAFRYDVDDAILGSRFTNVNILAPAGMNRKLRILSFARSDVEMFLVIRVVICSHCILSGVVNLDA